MIEDFRYLAAVIAAHPDQKVVGRTRLQKTVRLLQRLGLPTGFGYTIHFYGPYSEDLQSCVSLLNKIGLASELEHHNSSGEPYYVEHATAEADARLVKEWFGPIQIMSEVSPTVLELAATYDAFRKQGSDHDTALVRLKRKKGDKCDGENVKIALDTLAKLGLPAR